MSATPFGRANGGDGWEHRGLPLLQGRSTWVETKRATCRPILAPTSSAVRKWMPESGRWKLRTLEV